MRKRLILPWRRESACLHTAQRDGFLFVLRRVTRWSRVSGTVYEPYGTLFGREIGDFDTMQDAKTFAAQQLRELTCQRAR